VSRRVLLVTTAPTVGGVWRHIDDLAHGLIAEGCQVTVGLLREANRLQEAAERSGLEWRTVGRDGGSDTADVWHIHLHDTYDALALRLIAKARLKTRVVITEHLPRTHASDESLAPYFHRRRGATTAKTLFKTGEYKLASAVIAVGRDSGRFLEQRYRVPAKKLFVVPNGVDLPAGATPPTRSTAPLKVVALGSLIWQKGFDVLLDAAARSELPWKVTIIGSGSQRSRLEDSALSVGKDRVSFLDWVDDPSGYITDADVVCMPSRWESFPYTALEASALARPIVGSNVDGISEIVRDGVSGLLVQPDDAAELAGAIDRLAMDRQLASDMGAAGRQQAASFPIDAMIRGTLAAY
jgi:glycosyltransferase involved in cell wall biosynthesis